MEDLRYFKSCMEKVVFLLPMGAHSNKVTEVINSEFNKLVAVH